MNSSSAPRVRFACRLARFRSAFSGPSDAGHVARCADCQRYFAADQELERQLTLQARQPAPEVPAGMEERIFQALQPTLRRSRPRRSPARWVAMAGVGAAAAVVAFVAIQSRPAAPLSVAGIENVVTPENSATATSGATQLARVDQWSERLWGALNLDAAGSTTENPLQREIVAVQSDTRAALRFLAANFLPANQTVPSADETAPASS